MCSLAKICLVLGLVLLTSSWALADTNDGLLDCSNVIPITCGTVIDGDNSNSPNNVTEYGCSISTPGAGEDVYVIDLNEGDVFRAQVTTSTGINFFVVLLGLCDEAVCETYGWSALEYRVPTTGPYYLVIDAFGFNGGEYTLSVDCYSPEPPPGNDTCFNGACLSPGTDINFAGNLLWATNDFGDISCVAEFADAGGSDVVYEFALTNGNTFTADVTGDLFTDVVLMIVTDCDDPGGTCVAGADNDSAGNQESISYTHNGDPTLYYLIVKEWNPLYSGAFFTGSYSHDGLLCDDPISTTDSTWGSLKAIFR